MRHEETVRASAALGDRLDAAARFFVEELFPAP